MQPTTVNYQHHNISYLCSLFMFVWLFGFCFFIVGKKTMKSLGPAGTQDLAQPKYVGSEPRRYLSGRFDGRILNGRNHQILEVWLNGEPWRRRWFRIFYSSLLCFLVFFLFVVIYRYKYSMPLLLFSTIIAHTLSSLSPLTLSLSLSLSLSLR